MAISTHGTSYTTWKEILEFPDHYVAVARTFPKGDALAVVVDGRKIVKAGTIFPKNDATAIGVVMRDVDVTDDDSNGAIIVHGFVKTSKLPTVPTAEAIAALKMISFMPLTGIVPA